MHGGCGSGGGDNLRCRANCFHVFVICRYSWGDDTDAERFYSIKPIGCFNLRQAPNSAKDGCKNSQTMQTEVFGFE